MKITKEFLIENGFIERSASNGSYYSKNRFLVFYWNNQWVPCRIESGNIVIVGDHPLYFENQQQLICFYEKTFNTSFF